MSGWLGGVVGEPKVEGGTEVFAMPKLHLSRQNLAEVEEVIVSLRVLSSTPEAYAPRRQVYMTPSACFRVGC